MATATLTRPTAPAAERLAIDGGPKAVSSPIPYVAHGVAEIGEEEKANVLDVLERKAVFRWADAEKSYVARFEREFARKVGAKHALATCSGTAALVTGLTALGIGPGDEVIVPGYTFIQRGPEPADDVTPQQADRPRHSEGGRSALPRVTGARRLVAVPVEECTR